MSDHATSVEAPHGHEEHHGFAHPMPVWQLLAVFVALVLLTGLTVYPASFELGSMELVLSLLIATIKASLVILFFMHMIHDKPLNAIVFISSFVFVALFIGFTLMDALSNKEILEFKEVSPAAPVATAPAEPH